MDFDVKLPSCTDTEVKTDDTLMQLSNNFQDSITSNFGYSLLSLSARIFLEKLPGKGKNQSTTFFYMGLIDELFARDKYIRILRNLKQDIDSKR